MGYTDGRTYGPSDWRTDGRTRLLNRDATAHLKTGTIWQNNKSNYGTVEQKDQRTSRRTDEPFDMNPLIWGVETGNTDLPRQINQSNHLKSEEEFKNHVQTLSTYPPRQTQVPSWPHVPSWRQTPPQSRSWQRSPRQPGKQRQWSGAMHSPFGPQGKVQMAGEGEEGDLIGSCNP